MCQKKDNVWKKKILFEKVSKVFKSYIKKIYNKKQNKNKKINLSLYSVEKWGYFFMTIYFRYFFI